MRDTVFVADKPHLEAVRVKRKLALAKTGHFLRTTISLNPVLHGDMSKKVWEVDTKMAKIGRLVCYQHDLNPHGATLMIAPETKIRLLLFRSIRYLAGLLMDAGINAKEFVEIAKMAFVDAAAERYGRNGKPATVVDTVAKTRLSKNDIYRLRERIGQLDDFVFSKPPSNEAVVLMHWYTGDQYQDGLGQPLPLPPGPGPGSLMELIEICDVDASPSSIVARLRRQELVVETGDGLLEPVRRNVTAPKSAEGSAVALHSGLLRVCQTIAHNLSDSGAPDWIQRTVYSEPSEPRHMARLRRAITERSADFCLAMDDFLDAVADDTTTTATAEASGQRQRTRVGLGVFYFEDHVDVDSSSDVD